MINNNQFKIEILQLTSICKRVNYNLKYYATKNMHVENNPDLLVTTLVIQ